MRARLASRTGRLRGERFELEAEATIGRGIDNTIVLDDGQISTHHARIWFDDDRRCYLVEDLESTNGTQVDGVPVIHPEPLPGLHVITFASDLDFIFQCLPEESAADEPGAAVEAAGGEPPAGRFKRPVLAVLAGEGEPLRFALAEGSHEIGRLTGAAVQLELDQISRRHARLTVRHGRVSLLDLGSRNHTFVDGRQIEREVELAPGARIRFGTVEAELLDAP